MTAGDAPNERSESNGIMMIFRDRPWYLRWSGDASLPAEVTFVCEFEPLQAFGGPAPPGRTAGPENQRFVWRPRSGQQFVMSDPPLAPISLRCDDDEAILEVNGRRFVVTAECANREGVAEWARRLRTLLPLALGIEFADPATPFEIHGTVGDVRFTQLLAHSTSNFEVVTQEMREERVVRAWARTRLLSEPANRRLAMALLHFHIACRLQRCGASPWEFMAEALLNYAKSMEILFPDMSAMRDGLRALEVDEEVIDTWFLPLREIRNTFNVGHSSLFTLPDEHLETLHQYTDGIEERFRHLLGSVLERVEEGSFALPANEPSRKQRQRARARIALLEDLRRRLQGGQSDTDDTGPPT